MSTTGTSAPRLIALVALGFLPKAATPDPMTIEEVLRLPVGVTDAHGSAVVHPMTVTIFRDDRRLRSPFLVLNHGRPSNPVDFPKLGRVRFEKNAEYFVSQGFAVFVPTRVGYGATGGDDLESNGECSVAAYAEASDAAVHQVLAVVEYARSRPYVDPNRGIALGQSWGGVIALGVAAKGTPGLVAAVNFAGGGGGDPIRRSGAPCGLGRLTDLFASFGTATRVPTLWIYAENDRFWGKALPRSWFTSFRAGGAVGEFVALPNSETGHNAFSDSPEAWRAAFEQFLSRHLWSFR